MDWILVSTEFAVLPLFSDAFIRSYPLSHISVVNVNSVIKSSKNSFAVYSSPSRVQRIRDISLTKQILNDLTAAEFALKVEGKSSEKSKIDYEMLLSNINRSIELLNKRQSDFNDDLYQRLVAMRNELTLVADTLSDVLSSATSSSNPNSAGIVYSQPEGAGGKGVKENIPTLRVFVREDGTVDWEDAIASGKEVAKYGTELWERLNGKEEKDGLPSVSELLGQAQAKLLETPEALRLKAEMDTARLLLDNAVKQRNDARAELRKNRREGLDIDSNELNILRRKDSLVKELEKRLRLCTLNLDMERICVYVEQELQSSVAPAEDQRLIVAEVSLLDKQLNALLMGLTPVTISVKDSGSSSGSASGSLNRAMVIAAAAAAEVDDTVSLIDEDELSLVSSQVNDLKSRLGLETQGSTVNWGTLGVLVSDTLSKIRDGLNFYGLGTRIIIGDLQYAWSLLLKAAQGYTLKAREVNAVRRTGKDVLTLIPFTIILIIPLSPVGHVLVFSFIQRYFPDFFPSCYTEKRQNLWRLYSEIERKSDDELLGPRDEDQAWSLKDFIDKLSQDLRLKLKNITFLEPFTKFINFGSE
eukprot:gene6310-12768_t